MPLAEYGVLCHALDDLCNVMAEYSTLCIYCFYQLHFATSTVIVFLK